MTNKFWYALLSDPEDDWGTGFDDLERAKQELLSNDSYNLIAVIEIWLDDDGKEIPMGTLCKQEIWKEELRDPVGWLSDYEVTQEDETM